MRPRNNTRPNCRYRRNPARGLKTPIARTLVLLALSVGAVLPVQAATTVVASMLPNSRSVQLGSSATLFATILNAGVENGSNCRIEPDASLNGTFAYQTTNPTTNEAVGSANTPVDIPVGGFQTFVVTLTPSSAFAPREIALDFLCDNANAAGSIVGVNTFTFSASNPPVPDVVALGATPSADGVVELPVASNINVFSVASVNLGAGEELEITAELSDPSLTASITLCETDPITSVCINPTIAAPGPVTTQVNSDATPTFGIFVTSTGTVPFDPANNRIFVRFEDGTGAVRGATSVALRTEEIIPFTNTLVTGSSLWQDSTQTGRLAGIVAGLTFAANGTGVSYENTLGFRSGQAYGDISEGFSWSINSGLLNLSFNNFSTTETIGLFADYSDLVSVYGMPQSVADFFQMLWDNGSIGTELRLERTVVDRTARILTDQAGVLGVLNTTTAQYSMDAELTANGWTGALPDGTPQTSSINQTVYTDAALAGAPGQVVAAGDTWAVPFVFSPQDPTVSNQPAAYVVDALTFNGNGTTSVGRLSNESFSWANSGTTLVLTSGNEQHRIKTIESAGAQKLALAEYFINGQLALVSGQLIAQADATGSALASDLVNVDPITWQAGLNIWQADRYQANGVIKPEWVFGYQFPNAAEAGRVNGFAAGDLNCSGVTIGCFTKESSPLWDWSVSGDLITRSRDFANTLRTRIWEVLSYTPGGRAVVLESAVWKTGSSPARFVIPPRINTLEELDLNVLPAELANSPGF